MRYEIIFICITNLFILFTCVPVRAKICGEIRVANTLNELEKLRNCTIIAGSMQILFLEKNSTVEVANYSFPELEEVLGLVLFYRVFNLSSLGIWFPNLKIIRGYRMLWRASMIIHNMPQLREIGLKNLRLIEHGKVRIQRSPRLCFVSTIDWASLGTTLIIKNSNTSCTNCSKTCPNGYCWNETTCQNTTTFHDECPNYEFNKECVAKCPKNTVSLRGGKRCILEEVCCNLSSGNVTTHTWAIFDDICLHQCPCDYTLDCINICKGNEISVEARNYALDQYSGCHIINGSLILHIVDEKTYKKLPKYLGEIQEIRGALEIRRSPFIKNLQFLRNLQRIRGLNGTKTLNTSLIVLDNPNLEKLWDNFSLVLENGGIMFHYNHKLCLSEIKKLARIIGQNYTDFDVSPSSNGDQGACESHYTHNPKLLKISSNNVTMKWEVFNVTYESYTVYYKETDKDDDQFCGDDWYAVEGRANTPVILMNLLPFVNYSYYFVMNANSSYPYSRTSLYYVKTNPGIPSLPEKVRASSKQHDQMTLSWAHPKNPAGVLYEYVINYYMQPDSQPFMDQRNYCKTPESNKIDIQTSMLTPNSKIDIQTCDCRSKQINKNIENFNEDILTMYGTSKDDYIIEGTKTEFVNATNNTIDINGLKHFRLYVFLISVCNMFENRKLCSAFEMVYNRTLPKENADDISDFKVKYKERDMLLLWQEPSDPNSVIVSYDIWHEVNGHRDSPICITRFAHERNNFVYVINNLKAGEEHSVRVRARSMARIGRYSNLIANTILQERTYPEVYMIILPFLAAAVVCAAVLLYLYKRFKKNGRSEEMQLIPLINPEYMWMNCISDEWEIPRDDIEIYMEIGQGSFGTVFSGVIKPKEIPCAVKTISSDAEIDCQMEFIKEASVMKSISNAHHVVKLLGVVSQSKPLLVIMELMECGDMKSFLRKLRDSSSAITKNEMYRMAAEIADGMAYLAHMKVVHRDLSARNCMVSGDHTIKIGDFGMTRDIYQSDYYRKDSRGFFPVRWMAPESLADGVFSSSSDVWSYGVVLWEVSTLAEQPYQGLANKQVLQFIINRGILQRPPDCPDVIYEIMRVCWRYKPSMRPQFIHIVNKLQNFVGSDFQLVSYYHNRESKEYKRKKNKNSPQTLHAHTWRHDVTIYT